MHISTHILNEHIIHIQNERWEEREDSKEEREWGRCRQSWEKHYKIKY